MRRILAATVALLGLFLLSWLVCTALGVLTPDATGAWLRSLGPVTAAVAVAGLLAADIALPVPGSIVLSAGGIVLGWPLAAAAGCAGLLIGSLTGYGACRLLGRRAFDRFVTPAEAARFAGWLDRYGPAAIVTSRPVPMMAETLSCLAGLGGMRLPRFLLALLLGTAPYAWFFAWAGDRLGRVREKPGLALLVALAVPALYWIGFAVLAGRRKGRE
ncbi:MAG: TVP38/TMEM64 family protein [Planctomycetota bacterium]|jgi:uncharacterized membrane protein YdjX (TVP38/TMEM64 family)